MAPSDEQARNSGDAPTPSATTRVAEESGATPEGVESSSSAEVPGPEDATASPAEAPEDHEVKLEQDLDELAVKAQKADEYLELAQRTRADFENYRKRAAREAAAAQERGVVKLVRELLPAVDNLDRALEALGSSEPSSNGELVSGIKLVHAELIAALARAGVERFDPEGQRFDPECHEAVGQQPVEGTEPGMVVEVYQRGYRLGGSVIRPARVIVAG